MNLKTILPLGVLLTAIVFVSSCAQQGGSAGRDAIQAEAAAPPQSSASASRRKYAPKVQEDRPGLATGWGDEKESKLTTTYFTRASSKPEGIGAIFYNDKEGIKAIGNARKVAAMQTTASNLVEWGIKGRFGYLPAYKENGWGRRLVAGSKGSSYSIIVKNRSKSALEIVASVDGLDVQDGKTASFAKRGYIIPAGKTLEIEGFRTSYNKVAAFEFSSVSNSYANLKTGNTRNVGVIGIAVFTQKGIDPWRTNDEKLRGSARTFAEAP